MSTCRLCNVNLTNYYDQFVDELVTSGRFSNASEVMRAGLRLLEQQTHEDQEKLMLLRSLASEAFDELDRGQGTAIDGEPQLSGIHRPDWPPCRRRGRASHGRRLIPCPTM